MSSGKRLEKTKVMKDSLKTALSLQATALLLLSAGYAFAHEGENQNLPTVTPKPVKLVVGSNQGEVSPGRLQVYCCDVPASFVSASYALKASEPFTLYYNRDKQPVLNNGEVSGALRTEIAQRIEEEGEPTFYAVFLEVLEDRPGKQYIAVLSDTLQAVDIHINYRFHGQLDPFESIDPSGTYPGGRKLRPISDSGAGEHTTSETRYTVSTNITQPQVPSDASPLLPEEGIDFPAPTSRFKDYVVLLRKTTTYPLPGASTKTVVEYLRRDYRILSGVPKLLPGDVLPALNLSQPQEFSVTIPARAQVRALMFEPDGGLPWFGALPELEVRSRTVLEPVSKSGWYDFPVRPRATTYQLRLFKKPEAEQVPRGIGLRFVRKSISDKADLVVNALAAQPYVVEAEFPENDSEVLDGLVSPGRHRVIRWNGVTENVGGLPAMVPCPNMQPGLFEFHQTHRHFHYLRFMESRLLTPEGRQVAHGKKYSFALMDLQTFDPEAGWFSEKRMDLLKFYIEWRRLGGSIGAGRLLPEAWLRTVEAYAVKSVAAGWGSSQFRDFVCALSGLNPRAVNAQEVKAYLNGAARWSQDLEDAANWYQYISPGNADVYDSSTPGQMIEIDGVPEGNYLLEIAVSPGGTIREANLSNNRVRIPIYIPPASF
jgi:hypothetical protein